MLRALVFLSFALLVACGADDEKESGGGGKTGKGAAGVTGASGGTGAAAGTGAPGSTGSNGATGATGATAVTGATGSTGATGGTGATDSTPAADSLAAQITIRNLVYSAGTERKIFDPSANTPRQLYSYAPVFITEGGKTMVYSCHSAVDNLGDAIGYSESTDRQTWTPRQLVVNEKSAGVEPFACDPSVIRWTPPGATQAYDYIWFGGAEKQIGGYISVARRAVGAAGEFEKFTDAGTWVAGKTVRPKFLLTPFKACGGGGGSSCYGAGQPSVVLLNGKLHMWYTDTTSTPTGIWYATSADGLTWSDKVPTSLTGGDKSTIDVKFDPKHHQLLLFAMENHAKAPKLKVSYSVDGKAWTEQEVFGTAPDWSHNPGVGGDGRGHLILGEPTLIGYGAPYDLRPDFDGTCLPPTICPVDRGWAYWDTYAGTFTLE